MTAIPSAVMVAIVLIACLSILFYQGITGVPPMSSNSAEADDIVALLRQSGLPESAIVYELGCGWGSLVVALARAFPDSRIRGIELSPIPYWVARLRTRRLSNASVQRADFRYCDLADAQAVTCYLMPGSMPRLAKVLDLALRPGTPVVTLTFWFRDRELAITQGASALYFWSTGGLPQQRLSLPNHQRKRP